MHNLVPELKKKTIPGAHASPGTPIAGVGSPGLFSTSGYGPGPTLHGSSPAWRDKVQPAYCTEFQTVYTGAKLCCYHHYNYRPFSWNAERGGGGDRGDLPTQIHHYTGKQVKVEVYGLASRARIQLLDKGGGGEQWRS